MSDNTQKPPNDQRDMLEDSERAAAHEQPGSYRPNAIDDKVIEVLPIDGDSVPIKGLDPEPVVPKD